MKLLILVSLIGLAKSVPLQPKPLEHDPPVENTPVKITFLPYYGGAKGQTLKVTELANGTVVTEIIQAPVDNLTISENSQPSELEMPQLPHRPKTNYGLNLHNIHKTALNIIRLQEAAKKRGELNEEDETEYRENIESLHSSADDLANMYGADEDDDFLNFNDKAGIGPWLERRKNTKKDKDKKKEEEKKKKEEEKRKEEEEEEKRKEEERKEEEEDRKKEEEERKKKEEEEEKKRKEQEKKKEEEEEEEEGDNEDGDTIAVNLPPDDASVAEAKPVGLAIAGIGGVAASKPIATAVVGPGGLAIARPVGTSIAGVSPDQALVPLDGDDGKKGSKGEKGDKKKLSATEYLNRIIHRYHQV